MSAHSRHCWWLPACSAALLLAAPARAEEGGPCLTFEEANRMKAPQPAAVAPAKPKPPAIAEVPGPRPPAAQPQVPAAVPEPPPPPADAKADRIAPGLVAKRAAPVQVEQVTEETKKEVERLVADYFKALDVPAPSAEEKARIEKLVAGLGAEEWAAREEASKALVKIGAPAESALRQAARSKDAEVASRAREALNVIEAASRKPTLDALRKYPQTVWVVVQGQIEKTREGWTKANAAAAEADKAGRKDEAEKLRAEARALGGRISELDRLYWLVQDYTRYTR